MSKYLFDRRLANTSKKGGRFHNLSGQPLTLLSKKKKVFPDVEMAPPMFQFVHFASCPVPGHHSVKSLVFAPFFQVLVHADEIPP